MELHTGFWGNEGVAPALAAAMGTYKLAYASQAERPGSADKWRGNVLAPYDPAALLAETGALCPGKEVFCMVLLVDEDEEWVRGLLVPSA